MKKISKRKAAERKELLAQNKKHNLILGLSTVPPFALTVALTVLYAFRIAFTWLFAITSVAWIALGVLFIYATVKKWGYVTPKGVKSKESYSVITIYSIVIVFLLAILFFVMMLFRIF